MTVQRRTKHRAVLLKPMALLAAMLLCAGMAPTPIEKVTRITPVQPSRVFMNNIALTAIVIVVPPTQVVDPMTGVKDNQMGVMTHLLNGFALTQAGGDVNNIQYIVYPQSAGFLTSLTYPFGPMDPTVAVSRATGDAQLKQRIAEMQAAHPGEKIIVEGYSQGSSVNTWTIRDYANGDPSAPPADTVEFYNVANPNRPNGGAAERFVGITIPIIDMAFDGATPSNTPYKVTEIAHQYDGISDFPKDVWNIPAVLNAAMGMAFVHAFADRIDLNDPNNIVTHDGNLTDVLAYTNVLPIMQPFYITAHLLGIMDTRVLDALSEPLRVIIDSGYDRTTAAATPANWGLPFQNLKMEDLKASFDRAAEILKTGKSPLSETTTFSQFPDLSSVIKAATASPSDPSAITQAMTQSADKFLYGTPKAPTAPVESPPPAVNAEVVTETPKAPETVATVPDDPKPEPKLTLPKINLPKLPSFNSPVAPKPTPDAAPSDGGANKSTPQQQTKPVQKFGSGLQKTIDKVRDAITPNVPPPGSASQPSESSNNSTQAPRNGLQQKISDTVRQVTQGGAASGSNPDKADAPSSPSQHDSPSQHEGGDS